MPPEIALYFGNRRKAVAAGSSRGVLFAFRVYIILAAPGYFEVSVRRQMIRAQYYFRPSDEGLLAWDIHRLLELSRNLPVERVDLGSIAELDEAYWYSQEGDSPTCRSLLRHMQLIDEADLKYPIVLDQDGRVMDGMHRVCKAVLEGKSEVLAVRFERTPEPDFVGCLPDALPYDD